MEPTKPADKQPDPHPVPPADRDRTGNRRTTPAPKPVTTREFVAPAGGVVEGRAYWIDGHLVIADGTVGVGQRLHALTGVVEYAKVHEEAWQAGDVLYWYAFGGCLTNGTGLPMEPGTGRRVEAPPESTKVGVADKDAPNPSATGFVRLDAIPTAP